MKTGAEGLVAEPELEPVPWAETPSGEEPVLEEEELELELALATGLAEAEGMGLEEGRPEGITGRVEKIPLGPGVGLTPSGWAPVAPLGEEAPAPGDPEDPEDPEELPEELEP